MELEVKRVSENAKLPTRGSPQSAGYDLYASEPCVIKAQDKAIVSTGLMMAIPEGYYGRVAPRSGLTVKHFLDVGAGVIDCDYRGHVGVVLFNHSGKDYQVQTGDRIAQLLLEKIANPPVREVETLSNTERGEGGYGSSGKN